jgi:Phage capsid family
VSELAFMNVQNRGIPLKADPSALHERGMAMLVRSVIAVGNSKLNPTELTKEFLSRRWGSDAAVEIASVMRAASAPAMTTGATWAQPLAQVSYALLDALTGISAGASLLQRSLGLRFDGSAQISIPEITQPTADFVAEGAAIPVTSAVSNFTHLEAYKLAAIVVLTREMIESSNAETLVRSALVNACGPALDKKLFDTNAGTPALRPPGLLVGKTALTPSTNTDKLDAMVADLSALGAAVAPYAGEGGIVYVAAARQAVGINLGVQKEFPYPLFASSALPDGFVLCAAADAIVSAVEGAPALDMTKVASVQMNDSPTGDLMTGGRVSALFQTDQVGIRVKWPLSWLLRNPAAIAFMSAVTWP